MKKLLLSCGLLSAFLFFALSFCVLRFDVSENGDSPISFHYVKETDPLGSLHITLSRDAIDATEDFFGCIKETAKALPFFLTDTVGVIGREADDVVSLFSGLLEEDERNGALKI